MRRRPRDGRRHRGRRAEGVCRRDRAHGGAQAAHDRGLGPGGGDEGGQGDRGWESVHPDAESDLGLSEDDLGGEGSAENGLKKCG